MSWTAPTNVARTPLPELTSRRSGLFYRSETGYRLLLRLAHGGLPEQRYLLMANELERGNRVVDAGCGPAMLVPYLPADVSYIGLDMNPEFLRAVRARGREAESRDFRRPGDPVPCDVVVLCDVLHHLPMDSRSDLLRWAFDSARSKVMVCEPFLSPLLERGSLVRWLSAPIYTWFERDGINKVELAGVRNERDLNRWLTEGGGVLPGDWNVVVKKLGKDLLAVYTRGSR